MEVGSNVNVTQIQPSAQPRVPERSTASRGADSLPRKDFFMQCVVTLRVIFSTSLILPFVTMSSGEISNRGAKGVIANSSPTKIQARLFHGNYRREREDVIAISLDGSRAKR